MDQAVERRVELTAQPAVVWQALTQGAQLSGWFGASVELEARPGGRATFGWPDGRQREARVEVFDPERQLLLRWLPFERDARGQTRPLPAGNMRFVLESRDGHTLLTVTETVTGQERAMTMAAPSAGSRS